VLGELKEWHVWLAHSERTDEENKGPSSLNTFAMFDETKEESAGKSA